MKRIRYAVILALVLLCAFILPVGSGYVYAEEREVFVGGFPVGISIDVGGLLVESVTGVETEYGNVNVAGIERGDILLKLDGVSVGECEELSELLTEDPVTVELLRRGSKISVQVTPVVEAYSKKPRLGIKVKNRIFGVGTVTYVGADGRFTALGHEIFDGETGVHIPFSGGHIHACRSVGVKRGKKGEAGAIVASIRPEKTLGSIFCNNEYGIAGEFAEDFPKDAAVKIAARERVCPGPARIRTTINGEAEYYDIEIIRAVRQSTRKQKGIVFRITDKRLLEKTGGVVRGMSGSPILQNGKLVGAVTHVFLNDFTKGYGVYADCLN